MFKSTLSRTLGSRNRLFGVPYVPHVAVLTKRPTTCAAPGGLVFFFGKGTSDQAL